MCLVLQDTIFDRWKPTFSPLGVVGRLHLYDRTLKHADHLLKVWSTEGSLEYWIIKEAVTDNILLNYDKLGRMTNAVISKYGRWWGKCWLLFYVKMHEGKLHKLFLYLVSWFLVSCLNTFKAIKITTFWSSLAEMSWSVMKMNNNSAREKM